jgi:hypothetical protein
VRDSVDLLPQVVCSTAPRASPVSPSRTTHVQHIHRHPEARNSIHNLNSDHNIRVTHPDGRRTSR